ncbi:RtcB family protein [Candidatus Micrarchaeota archaeon]|nr:RtcB family protein [Candidatus Micrarchaeota archaeon]
MKLEKISKAIYRMPPHEDMKVPAYIFANEKLIRHIRADRTLSQLKNVASLPGIVKYALAMPDAHEGYGFPIGGVAAFDAETGIISPGGVGYDINCGIRLVTVDLTPEEVKSKIKELCDKLFINIPSGVGSQGKLRISHEELDEVALRGVEWAVEKGYGRKEDIQNTEEYGRIEGADPSCVSPTVKKRGKSQLGTLGAGNHFLEMQEIQQLFDEETAKKFGLEKGKTAVMIHTGSRGYGHQICTDHVKNVLRYAESNNLFLPDRELAYAPIQSREGSDYLKAMRCGVNFAFTNRQVIMHWVRETFDNVFGPGTSDSMHLVYDVAHNIAKMEEHVVDGEKRKLIVHRKGATRSFPAGRPELPEHYSSVGHPVLIAGTMGTASYVLVGEQKGLELTFGSTCHGSGRTMSRGQAIRTHDGAQLAHDLLKQGIYVKATKPRTLAEEAPDAYKNVDDVVASVAEAGISRPVARMKPLGVVKG